MLHSKFSISFDQDTVSIWIQITVNNEKTFLNPCFDFDQDGKIIIPGDRWGYNKETLKLVSRHVKTTLAKLIKYLEDSFEDYKLYDSDETSVI